MRMDSLGGAGRARAALCQRRETTATAQATAVRVPTYPPKCWYDPSPRAGPLLAPDRRIQHAYKCPQECALYRPNHQQVSRRAEKAGRRGARAPRQTRSMQLHMQGMRGASASWPPCSRCCGSCHCRRWPRPARRACRAPPPLACPSPPGACSRPVGAPFWTSTCTEPGRTMRTGHPWGSAKADSERQQSVAGGDAARL